MEVIKYLCEFFFTNFWHWLGLVVILAIVFRFGIVSFANKFTEINRGGVGGDVTTKNGNITRL